MPVTSKRTGTGENKKWESGNGKATTPEKAKEYHKNPETGKIEEYKGVDYIPDKKKVPGSSDKDPQVPTTKSEPRFHSRASFD